MEVLYALLIAGFLSGLAGSVHCAGMCGPLAGTLSLFVSPEGKWGNTVLQFSYNSGRLVSYSLIGLLLGLIGEGTNQTLALLLPFQEFAAWIGIAALAVLGISMILGKSPTSNQRVSQLLSKFSKPILGELKDQTASSGKLIRLGFSFGLLTGLLPCGILYPAFVTAFASGSPLAGAAIMASFFLGTFPLLFIVGIGFRSIFSRLRGSVTKYAGGFIIAVSIFMILLRFQHNHSEMADPQSPSPEHSHHHHH